MRHFLNILSIAVILLFSARESYAQSDKIYHPMIYTLQTIVNENWLNDDVITLDSDDRITISFDHFSHDYHRFIYKITHCNADWTPSDLFDIDYMEGFNGLDIEDYATSLNTTMLYTHYSLELPNDEIQFKVSGNYKVEFYLDEEVDSDNKWDTEQPVAVACFRIVEPRVSLAATVTSNTDIDTNLNHQQVSFTINHNGYNIINPTEEIKPYIYQNNRTDNCVYGIKPTYTSAGVLEYIHNQQLIFPAGNEYRRFEVINMHYATQGVDKISYFGPYYHAELYPNTIRRNYSYDEDHNGHYLIRYNLAEDNNTEADYMFVHFRLNIPYRPEGSFYLTGEFTYNEFTPNFQAKYNSTEKAYEAVIILKQGAYDYMYVWVPNGSDKGYTAPTEGNFYETENEYQIYIYHRPFGGRYDRLVASQQIKFTQD